MTTSMRTLTMPVSNQAYVGTQFHSYIKAVRTDNAPDLCEGNMKVFYLEKGIQNYKTCPNTPEQNGVVERKHKHLLETARALYFQSNLPLKFWGDCVLTAAYLINRMPLQSLNFTSPYEKLLEQKPNLSHLRAFGCLCYVSTLPSQRSKFDPQAHPCVFIGYPNAQKGYRVFDLVSNKVLVSRNVIFYEKNFPFHLPKSSTPSHSPHFPFFLPVQTTSVPITDDIPLTTSDFPQQTSSSNSSRSTSFTSTNSIHTPQPLHNSSSTHTSDLLDLSDDTAPLPPPRHSTRQSKPPSYLSDYVYFVNNTGSENVSNIKSYSSSVSTEIAETAEHKEASNAIKILTYNVWFREDLELHKRMQAIGDLIQLHSPDVICFQEVTPDIYVIFQSSNWWKNYRCSVTYERVATKAYFCMQMSKLPVKSFSCKQFSYSAMGRELCVAKVEVNQSVSLVAATSHLESPCPRPPTWDQMFSKERVNQAKDAINILQSYPNVIFCGDMNWDDKLDGRFPYVEGWFDAWQKLRPADVGYTYDTKSNIMLSKNRTLQKRLDRFICHLTDFEVSCIDMIGTEAIPGLEYIKQKKLKDKIQDISLPVYPSDHFGLLLTITRTK